MDGLMDRWKGGSKDGRMDGWVGGWTRKEGRKEGRNREIVGNARTHK
jgi:hypothetical protein